MKKFIVSLMMIMVLFATSVQAAPRRGGHHFSSAPAHHQPLHKPHHYNKHYNKAEPIVGLVAGLVGGIIGGYIANDYNTPVQQTSTHCVTSTSYLGKTQVKKCVETVY